MAERTIHWGILGLGWMADQFSSDFGKVSGCRISALGSRSKAKAVAFRQKHGLHEARIYESYGKLCADPDLDIIYIATPHSFHLQHTLMALDAGKAVLCEKPLATNHAQAQIMLEKARSRNLFLMEAMWTAFLPVIRKVRELLDTNTLGKMKRISGEFNLELSREPGHRLNNPHLAGGALLDLGVYPLFLVQNLFQDAPLEIEALATLGETGVDEQLTVILKYPDDRYGLVSSGSRFHGLNEVRIEGTGGVIRIPEFWTANKAEIRPLHAPSYEFEAPQGYHFQIEEVNACLRREQKECPLVPPGLSARVLQTMDIIRKKIGLSYPWEPSNSRENSQKQG